MIKFVHRNYRSFLTIIFWIIVIVCVIFGWFIGISIAKMLELPLNDEGAFLLIRIFFGGIGLLIGTIIITIFGGFITTLLTIEENITLINRNITLLIEQNNMKIKTQNILLKEIKEILFNVNNGKKDENKINIMV